MFSKRKRYSSEFKAKVAVEAIKEQKTLPELAAEFSIHPNQIIRWKKQILDNSPEIFNQPLKNQQRRQSSLEDELYRQIGQLKVEIDWLKKKFQF